MSFNRRGGPDRRPDRPPRREGGYGDRPGGRGDRPYQPRDRGGGERPYQPRDRGGERPYPPRPRFDRGDEGGMSIRLDPRRLGALKRLAGDAGMRPGDLVRQWVEERIDADRLGAGGVSLEERIGTLEERIAALEATIREAPSRSAEPTAGPEPAPPPQPEAEAERPAPEARAEPESATSTDEGAPEPPARGRRAASAAPSGRVALHDEMIAVIAERGPMTAAELAAAIAERGRYAPPRSGKPLDAAMVSQRASNPTYRSRFVRREGRIGLASAE